MGYIETRAKKDGTMSYKAQVRLKGYPIQTASFSRKTDAQKWMKQTEAAIFEGRHFKTAQSKKHTFKELIERYEREVLPLKPQAKQESQYAWWKAQLGRYVLADITPALISEYRDKLLHTPTLHGKKRSPGTVLRYLAALSHALTTARDDWGWIEQSPMEKVRKPSPSQGRVRCLSLEEREKLLEACKASSNPFLHTIVVLAISTGMRKSEILTLCWQTVDLEKGRITLHRTKNGERRTIHITGYALQLIKELRANAEESAIYLFPGQNGQKCQKPIDIRSSWETAVKRAGITNFKFHDLRHCAASYLAMNSATLSEISQVLGHKTLAMVKRYSHISEEHTSSVVERMNQSIFPTAEKKLG